MCSWSRSPRNMNQLGGGEKSSKLGHRTYLSTIELHHLLLLGERKRKREKHTYTYNPYLPADKIRRYPAYTIGELHTILVSSHRRRLLIPGPYNVKVIAY